MLVLDFFSPECSEKPTAKNNLFSWRKRTTNGSSFFDIENDCFGEDLQRNAGLATPKTHRNALEFADHTTGI
jgi:hypothetical protein